MFRKLLLVAAAAASLSACTADGSVDWGKVGTGVGAGVGALAAVAGAFVGAAAAANQPAYYYYEPVCYRVWNGPYVNIVCY
jgi:hypothetical protein